MKKVASLLLIFCNLFLFSQAIIDPVTNTTNSSNFTIEVGIGDASLTPLDPANFNNFTISVGNAGSFLYTVEWGDGTTDSNVTGDITHTYTAAGIYDISISGTFGSFNFSKVNSSAMKILRVKDWSSNKWESTQFMFLNAENLLDVPTDHAPDLSKIQSGFGAGLMFKNCFKFNSDLSVWSTQMKYVYNISQMFYGCKKFTGTGLSDWRLDKANNLFAVFQNCDEFDANINNWFLDKDYSLYPLSSLHNAFFNCKAFDQPLDKWGVAVGSIKNFYGVFSGTENFNQDLSSWDMSNAISLSAMFRGSSFNNPSISNWDTSNVTNMELTFSNAKYSHPLNWDVSSVKNFTRMFQSSFGDMTLFSSLVDWNVTQNAVNMHRMFVGAQGIESVDLKGWDVSKVTDMASMFLGAANFNGNLSNWDVSSVVKMSEMFKEAKAFNGDLSTWEPKSATSLQGMFNTAEMFNNAGKDMSGWGSHLIYVESIQDIFANSGLKDIKINNWNLENVLTVQNAFYGCDTFNGEVSNWNLPKCFDFKYMFKLAEKFNQDVSSWKFGSLVTSNIIDMEGMFHKATNFNNGQGNSSITNAYSLGNWGAQTEKVLNMKDMFGFTKLNQDLGSWDISNVTDMSGFLEQPTSPNVPVLSFQNFDNTIIGWVAKGFKVNFTMDMGLYTQYCGSRSAIDLLEAAKVKIIYSKVKACSTPDCVSDLYIENSSITTPLDYNNVPVVGNVFKWTPSSTAHSYDIDYYYYSNGTKKLVSTGEYNTEKLSFADQTPLLNNVTYYFQVNPRDSINGSTECTALKFVTEKYSVKPSCVQITAPFDGSDEVPVDVVVSWNRSSNTDSYKISLTNLDTDIKTELNPEENNENKDSFTRGLNLQNDTNYQVEIIATNVSKGDQDIVCNSKVKFKTEKYSTKPDCIAPNLYKYPRFGNDDVTVQSPEIKWFTPVNSRTEFFDIYIYPKGYAVDKFDLDKGVVYNAKNLLPDPSGTNLHKVNAVFTPGRNLDLYIFPKNNKGYPDDVSICSAVTFSTKQFVSAPTVCPVLDPSLNNKQDVDVDSNIVFSTTPQTEEYFMSLSTNKNFDITVDPDAILKKKITNINGNKVVFDPSFRLKDGKTTYYVKLYSENREGDNITLCSTVYEFETELHADQPSSCPDLTKTVAPDNIPVEGHTFSWESISDATGYKVSIGSTSTSGDIYPLVEVSSTSFTHIVSQQYNRVAMSYGNTYYLSVTPFNKKGDGCTSVFKFDSEAFSSAPVDCVESMNIKGSRVLDAGVIAYNVPVDTQFEFTPIKNTLEYIVRLGTSPNGTDVLNDVSVSNPLIDIEKLFIGLNYNYTTLDTGEHYYMSVTPSNNKGSVQQCKTYEFFTQKYIQKPSGCPIIELPATADLGQVSITPTFKWGKKIDYVEKYIVSLYQAGSEIYKWEVPGDVYEFNPRNLPNNSNFELSLNSTYDLRVQAWNSNSELTDPLCNMITFTTEAFSVAPQDCVTEIITIPGTNGVSKYTDIKWDKVANATIYDIKVGTSEGADNVLNKQDFTALSIDASDLNLENGITYYVSIKPRNSAGPNTQCSNHIFTVEAFSDVPSTCSVIDSFVDPNSVAIGTDISWSYVEDATFYELKIGTQDGTSDIYYEQNITSLSKKFKNSEIPFKLGNTYFIQVIANNDQGPAKGCSSIKIKIEDDAFAPSDCPKILLPTYLKDLPVNVSQISWSQVDRASKYTFELSKSSDFSTSSIIVKEETDKLFAKIPSNVLETATTYYVRIIPSNSKPNDPINFVDCYEVITTQLDIDVPQVCADYLFPREDTDVDFKPVFEWSQVPGARAYDLYLGFKNGYKTPSDVFKIENYTGKERLDLSQPITVKDDQGNDITVDIELEAGRTYVFTAIPRNTKGVNEKCFGEGFTFTTKLYKNAPEECPVFTKPESGLNFVIGSTIIWSNVTNATSYTVLLGTSEDTSEILIQDGVENPYFTIEPELLEGSRKYYFSVIPVNPAGTGCKQTFEFTTENLLIKEDDKTYGVSPNGDGIGDYWRIEGIGEFKKNKVCIFNRWGDMVFKMSNYNNIDRVFEGQANGNAITYGGSTLPSGTYFYSIVLFDDANNEFKTIKGFIELKR